MASPITFGGLASGIDTNSIIEKLVQVERQPITTLQQERADQQARKALVTSLTSKLSALADSLKPLELQSGVQGRAVSTPGGAPFTATVTGTAPVGSYDISVLLLAQAQRTYSNSFASADVAAGLNAGTVTLTTGGKSAQVSVTAADTLSDVAGKINNAGLALSAAVIYDGAQYRIVINGQSTGGQNAISFSDPASTGLGLDVPANTVVQAQDAKITVDGLTARSSTNTFSGIIPGVTLTVAALSAVNGNGAPATTALRVEDDPGKLSMALQAIVSSFNAAMGAVQAQIPAADGTKRLGSNTLVGETVVRDAQVALMSFTTTAAGPVGNRYGTLAELGVSIDRYGTMTLDQQKLRVALTRDAGAVTNLLTGSSGVMKKLGAMLKGFTDFVDGTLSNKGKTIDSRIQDIDAKVEQLDRAATAYETNLRQQFAAMEQLIASFNSQTSSLTSILAGSSTSNK